jgi:hypothetical protein
LIDEKLYLQFVYRSTAIITPPSKKSGDNNQKEIDMIYARQG